MYGHDVIAYKKRLKAFGWKTFVVNGHRMEEVLDVYKSALKVKNKPVMIIARTIKGKGVSFWENKNGWHGKALSQEQLEEALKELGQVDTSIRGVLLQPEKEADQELKMETKGKKEIMLDNLNNPMATREAYGYALAQAGEKYPELVALDAEVSNSTHAEEFKKRFPKRFFEMFIAEQNMVGAGLGLSLRGKIPMLSTFAAFFSRAHDQIRMCQYSEANIKFVGSHCGVSIGQDGASQMGLEDLAMFRSIHNSVVLYPCDAVSCAKLVEEAIKYKGLVYIRTTRAKTKIIYKNSESFRIGGCKILKESNKDMVTLVSAGITVHEALRASERLFREGIRTRVIDLYSIKPLDKECLQKAGKETKAIVVIEDHYAEGGIGEAVASALADTEAKVYFLAVKKLPVSGLSKAVLKYEEIDAETIVKRARKIVAQFD